MVATERVLKALQAPNLYQVDAIEIYKTALTWYILNNEDLDWLAINQAIIDKWSYSGLTRIKEAAWRW